MAEETYTFTRQQLGNLLDSAIEMFIEYRDKHGRLEDEAAKPAVMEMLEGLDAARELVAAGELDPAQAGMVIDPSPKERTRDWWDEERGRFSF